MKVNCAVLVFYVFFLGRGAKTQYPSPCPDIFRYNDRDAKSGRWFATLLLVPSEDLNGVWVQVVLDRAAEGLTSSNFGKATAINPKEYLIANDDFLLQNQKLLTVNISAKYNVFDIIPSVVRIRLNGRIICGNVQATTTTTTTTTTTRPTTIPQIQCGTISKSWRWPWAVIIQHLDNGYSLENYCGGVLISDWHVLTSGNCITRAGNYPWKAEELVLYLGTDRLKQHGPGYQLAHVVEIHKHPDFRVDPFLHDLAVLKLARAVIRTDYVTPMCIPEENNVIGKTATLLRYVREEGRVSLKELKMPVVPRETCLQADRNLYSTYVSASSPKSFCGWYTSGNVRCSGLTGCGLVSESPDGLHWRLHGIETAAKVGEGDDCQPEGYAVFVNVTHYVDWLKLVTGLR